jgi:thymidylate synthase
LAGLNFGEQVSLGELCWYLAGTNDLNFISYYIPEYRKSAEGDKIFGGYGPRLFDWRGLKQLPAVIDLLKRRRDSRQAVIQLFDRYDITEDHKDVPCTCTMQFMIRKDRLHMFTNMRSNDVILGLPHDFFCFTMLQEIMARDLSVELGTYKHAVGSLHLYDRNKGTAQQFLDEGWQSTQAPMPPMPTGDPWPAVAMLREAEFRIRTTGEVGDGIDGILDTVNVYWADIIRLLQVFQCKKNSRDSDRIRSLRGKISSNVYFPFIDKMLNELT